MTADEAAFQAAIDRARIVIPEDRREIMLAAFLSLRALARELDSVSAYGDEPALTLRMPQ